MIVKHRPLSALMVALGLCWICINSLHIQWLSVSRKATSTTENTIPVLSSGQRIVEKAYRNSFEMFESCSKDEPFWMCIRTAQQNLTATTSKTTDVNASSSNNNKPWWFHTMLRDALPTNKTTSNLFGFWHDLTFFMPNNDNQMLKMCSIEKIGTKHWRKVQCKLNRPDQTNLTGQPCNIPDDELTRIESTHKFVFLRDPLERFLSGFLDKCERTRLTEGHCEPLAVFQESVQLVEGIVDHKRTFFETYVDTMPIKWNMHFYPLSLYCDGLFRHLHEYTFVGSMGASFYEDVHQFGQLYPNHTRLHNVLEEVFKLDKHLASLNASQNVGVETAAASYVQEYYSARTVRRVLEYMAIDYVRLGLSIPSWAQDMLDSDETII